MGEFALLVGAWRFKMRMCGQTYYKNINTLQNNCFAVKITKRSFYKANSFVCSLANRDEPSGSNITKKMFWWNWFVIATKMSTNAIVPKHYFVIISARMVCQTISYKKTVPTLKKTQECQEGGFRTPTKLPLKLWWRHQRTSSNKSSGNLFCSLLLA